MTGDVIDLEDTTAIKNDLWSDGIRHRCSTIDKPKGGV